MPPERTKRSLRNNCQVVMNRAYRDSRDQRETLPEDYFPSTPHYLCCTSPCALVGNPQSVRKRLLAVALFREEVAGVRFYDDPNLASWNQPEGIAGAESEVCGEFEPAVDAGNDDGVPLVE